MTQTLAIDVSPEACAARHQRIEAAYLARKVRTRKMAEARATYRTFGLRDDDELLQALQNIHAAAPDSRFKGALLELITDIDGELHEGEPELPAFNKVGELDGYTQGVRGRA